MFIDKIYQFTHFVGIFAIFFEIKLWKIQNFQEKFKYIPLDYE